MNRLGSLLVFVLVLGVAASAIVRGQRPASLVPERLETSEAISYFIADGRDVPGWNPTDQDLARMAFDLWARSSVGQLRFIEAASAEEALIRLVWVSAADGLFGETQRIRVNGRPGAFVYVMPDVSQLGEELAARAGVDRLLRDTIVFLTCVHELGHAIGLRHTDQFSDIMYSFAYGGDLIEYFLRYRRELRSRLDIQLRSPLSPADNQALHLLYSSQSQ